MILAKMFYMNFKYERLPIIGIMKASVFPDPVLAVPRISKPRRAKP